MKRRWERFKPRLKDIRSTTADISRTSLVALKDSSDACPPLKSACSGLLVIWDTIERVKSSKDDGPALANQCTAVLKHLADAGQADPANISAALKLHIEEFERLLDDILLFTKQMAKRRTGAFRFFKGLKRLNRDEAELRQFQRRLDEAARAFFVAMTARAEVSMTRIGGSTTRIEDSTTRIEGSMTRIEGSMTRTEGSTARIEGSTSRIENSTTRTELSTTQIQLSISNLELSNSRTENNVQALQKDLKWKTDFFVVSLAYGSAGSLKCMTSSHSPEIRIHMGCSGPSAKTSISALPKKTIDKT
ncbi:hypothetical protein C8J56DRAFT_974178 [Mycena floridula]|nr:hypothetical protein C8J56DRAFT_974178 [Mycena floridula]